MVSHSGSTSEFDSVDKSYNCCPYKPEECLASIGQTGEEEPIYCRHRSTVWCALCYGRFAHCKKHPWQAKARILGVGLPEEATMWQGVVSISPPVTFAIGNMFELWRLKDCDCECDCDDRSFLFEAYTNFYFETEHEQPVGLDTDSILIPVHEVCIDIYKQHLRSNLPASNRSVDKICADALAGLLLDYENVLSIDPEVTLAFDICAQAESLNGHYGALKPFQWVTEDQFHPTSEDDGFVYDACCSNRVFDMDPLNIDSAALTSFILSNLDAVLLPRLDPKRAMGLALEICPGDRLPQELLDMVATCLSQSCVDLPRRRNGLLPGSWWKQELIKGKLLPWLWDIDKDMVEKKERSLPKNWFGAPGTWIEWDWEGLIRKLSQTQFYKDLTIHRVGEGPQLALKNRRRIFLIMHDLCSTIPEYPRRKKDIDWRDNDCQTETRMNVFEDKTQTSLKSSGLLTISPHHTVSSKC